MRFTIKSRLFGDMDFFRADGDGNRSVYLESGDRPGTLGSQICFGGGCAGSTITCSEANFETTARRWYRSYYKLHADERRQEIGEEKRMSDPAYRARAREIALASDREFEEKYAATADEDYEDDPDDGDDDDYDEDNDYYYDDADDDLEQTAS